MEEVTVQQHEVQRLLGRCMLRLQQYEGLMKALLAHHELSGFAAELQSRQAARVTALATVSLGDSTKCMWKRR